MKFDVFLSHNGKDKPAVEQLAHKLEDKGLKVWLDKWNLIPGNSWQEEIEEALDNCQTFAVFLGPSGIGPWENVEMRSALSDRVIDRNRRVIPVLLPGAPDNNTLRLPRFLSQATWVDFRIGLDNENALYRLECGIKGIAPGKSTEIRPTSQLPNDKIPSPGDLPLGSYLPLPSNGLFTGRKNELKELANNLLDKSKSGIVIIQAVTGMGGLGKTQLAVEFGYRYGKYFRGVHWINLADPSQLDSEIANCGREMDFPNFPEEQSEQVKLTLNTWKTTGPNLLILDNFEEPNQANHVFNKLRHSNIRILVTSRRIDWYPTLGVSKLALEIFSPDESVSFLQKFFEGSYTNREDSKNDLESLAERLGHLPLSLELASRYLRHKRLKIPEYLKKADDALEHASMKDWRVDKETATKHDLSLQRTFALSWQEVKKELEQKIFMTTGYLAPNAPIPLEIFERTFSISEPECDESLETLYDLGLFLQTNIKSPNTESKTSLPIVHSLLCEYARSLAKEDKEILEVLADTILHLSSEALDTRLPANSVLLRPHLPALAIHAERGKLLKMAGALQAIYGSFSRLNADYPDAHEAYEQTLKILETTFGTNHESVAFATKALGSLLRDMGDLNGAKEKLELALKLGEVGLGANHAEIAKFAIDLGLAMRDLGDLNGAKKMFERAWEIIKANPTKASDPLALFDWAFLHKMDDLDDGIDLKIFEPSTATLFNGYGGVLHDLGNLLGAKKMYERALKIDEINFGMEHPDTAQSLNNLGRVLHDLKDLDGAKELLERATRIWEKNLDSEHPNVATGLKNLASVLQDMDDLHGAREYYERALNIAESKLGKNHPDIAGYLNDLGTLMQAMFDFEDAYPILERALNICESTLPPNHPRIAILTYNLAETMFALGKIDDARSMYERSLKIHEIVYGTNHPKVKELKFKLNHISDIPSHFFTNLQENSDITELENFVSFLIHMGELNGAKDILKWALRILEKNLGTNDIKIARVVDKLKNLMESTGDFNGAKEMLERALKIDEANLGEDHPKIAASVKELATLMRGIGDFNGAKKMFERLLKIYELNFGLKHLKVATVVHELAVIYYQLGDLNSTKEMLERALKIYEINFRKNHPNLSIAFSNLSSLMKELGDMNGAKEMLERAMEIDKINFYKDYVLYTTDTEDIPLISRLQFTGYPGDLKIIEVSNMASSLRTLGDLNDAKLTYENALKIFESNLGSNHNLGKLYNRFGRLLFAENDLIGANIMFEHALKFFEENLGSNHPSTKQVIGNQSLISLMQRPGCVGWIFRFLLIFPRYKEQK